MGKKARELEEKGLSCFFVYVGDGLTENKHRTKVRFLYTFPMTFATIEHNNF